MAGSVLRVLIVEDSASDAELMVRALRQGGCEIVQERVQTAEAMRAALARQSWDVVLSDYSLPHFDAPAALAVVRARAAARSCRSASKRPRRCAQRWPGNRGTSC